MLSPEIPPASAEAKLTTPHLLLLVEDEDLIREMIVVALEEEGYQVQTATDGRTAWNFLQSNQVTTGQSAPALIILDLMLPEINGFSRWKSF